MDCDGYFNLVGYNDDVERLFCKSSFNYPGMASEDFETLCQSRLPSLLLALVFTFCHLIQHSATTG